MTFPPPSPNSTAIVTGASAGIGVEIARSLARRGHGVTLIARRREPMEALADELRQAHDIRAEVLTADLADRDSREAMFTAFDGLGLDAEILVNNAGYGTLGRFHELDLDTELHMARLLTEGVLQMSGHFLPPMVRRGRGAIMNVASIVGFQPMPRHATYSASKAFVIAFTQAMRADLHGTGVSATVMCPGPVKTEFAGGLGVDNEDEFGPKVMFLTSSEVAEMAVSGLEAERRMIVPGWANRAATIAGQHTPRGPLLTLARRYYKLGA